MIIKHILTIICMVSLITEASLFARQRMTKKDILAFNQNNGNTAKPPLVAMAPTPASINPQTTHLVPTPETISDQKTTDLSAITLTRDQVDPAVIDEIDDSETDPLPELDSDLELMPELDTDKEKEALQKLDANAINIEQQEEETKNELPELVEFHFENADLQNFIKQIESIFDITFLSDDALEPLMKGARAIKGNKITFHTNTPLKRDEAWDLFLTFMQVSGFSVVKHSLDRVYRITTIESARKMPIPTFIGTAYETLPDNDELIRYVYFVENSSLETITEIVNRLRSTSSSLIFLREQKAFILIERAYNIKKLMEIVKELDKATVPQSMRLLKLQHADAKQIKELYDSIMQSDDKNNRLGTPPRKQQNSSYFPDNLKIIVEPRQNALIFFGPEDVTLKVEKFITEHIDKAIAQAYGAFFVHPLKYADATTIADIMNEMSKFGQDTEAGKFGGVRANDQYMQPALFVPEKETNSVIVKAKFENYLRYAEIMETLDTEPQQIEMEILILSVILNQTKELGAQIRSKDNAPDGVLGTNVKFQTSGMFGTSKIVENSAATSGVQRLLGNLLDVVKGAGSGNTIVTLGSDLFGVFGVFQALQTVANTNTIANPFFVATNKIPTLVSVGEERRVVTANIIGNQQTESFGTDSAKLTVNVTPQINSDGMILLDLNISFDDYISTSNLRDASKNTREIKTSTIVADKEVLALGGLVRRKSNDNMSKVPILGDIPGIGWLFKNKHDQDQSQNILILVSARIMNQKDEKEVAALTDDRIGEYRATLGEMYTAAEKREPIHKLFFADNQSTITKNAESLMFRGRSTDVANKRKRSVRHKRQHAPITPAPSINHDTQKEINDAVLVADAAIKTAPIQPRLEEDHLIDRIKRRRHTSVAHKTEPKGEQSEGKA